MKPYELAAQLPDEFKPEPESHPKFEELGVTLNLSEKVWEELQAGIFERDEFGYVKFNVMGLSRHENPDNVRGIQVIFIDPTGTQLVLGGIYRDDEPQFGYAMASEDRHKIYSNYLSPEDERWDVIVGTINRAVDKCIIDKEENKLLGKEGPVEYQGPELKISIGFYAKTRIAATPDSNK